MKKLYVSSLCLLLMACNNTVLQPEYSTNTPQPENAIIESYFTPSTDCEENIIAYIKKSQNIDIAIYSITNQRIVDALISAHNNGAKIRMVSDKLQAKGKNSLVSTLKQAGIPVRLNKIHKIEHNKFAVFDGRYVETGSYNWTTAATYHNSENCIFLNYPNSNYITRFQYLWDKYE